MEDRGAPEWQGSTYAKWAASEGVPIIRGYAVEDLRKLPLEPWERKGGSGAIINLEGAEQSNDAYVCEIPAGGKLKPQKHMYEELILILSGKGATTIWQEGGHQQTFEWEKGSLFSPPLNTWHQHFNGSGDEPARYIGVTSAPLLMNLFHSRKFIFDNPFVFDDRFSGEEGYFNGKGQFFGRVWESNFVSDVATIQLKELKERGAGGTNIAFELSNNTMGAHISEFPVGTYKKGHRHGPGAQIVIIGGKGYSLLWREGDKEFIKVNWQEGSLFVPPNQWYHQHFNVGRTPARYLALRWGSYKYRGTVVAGWDRDVMKSATSTKEGGQQIEYEDEDPRIRRMFEEALAKEGAELRMPPVQRNP